MEIIKSVNKVKIIFSYLPKTLNRGQINEADLKKLNLKIKVKDYLEVGELRADDIEFITFSVKEGE